MQPLTDGEPLTYDVINNIIKKVNAVSTNLTNIVNNQLVRVVGAYNYGSQRYELTRQDILIQVGTARVRYQDKQSIERRIEFNGPAFAFPPLVVASISDFRDEGEEAEAPYAVVAVKNVSNIAFNCKIEVIKIGQKNNFINVNYIAIGKSKQ